jgi:purine-binding chemotaxis protein CheW
MKNIQAVVFGIGKEAYGVPIEAVQEIVRVPEITALPEAPEYFQGVINLRGRIVPVMDLRSRLGLARQDLSRSSRVLVIQNSGKVAGLLVDAVHEVRKLPADAVEAPPEMVSAVGIEYITGVAKAGARLIVFLDIEKIVTIDTQCAEAVGAGMQPAQKMPAA